VNVKLSAEEIASLKSRTCRTRSSDSSERHATEAQYLRSPAWSMSRTRRLYNAEEVRRLSETTIAYYDRFARAFWDGTRRHDVSQNYAAFLNAIEGDTPYSILDLGCGPGRDLSHFRSLGHEAVGLDGSQQVVAMARAHSRCEVLHQDLLAMRLPESRFDGVFANASLFHVPSQ
jgi:SAM-dependent methyltransferase